MTSEEKVKKMYPDAVCYWDGLKPATYSIYDSRVAKDRKLLARVRGDRRKGWAKIVRCINRLTSTEGNTP